MAADHTNSLYGIPRPKATPKHEISSSTALAFTSQLSTLLAQSRPQTTTSARHRPSKARKDDIFTAHNRNSKKRAAADISSDGQVHKPDIGAVDASTLQRSKRKMEEKARLYAAMKRGDYIPPSSRGAGINDDERQPLVDFDRKWAEAEAAGKDLNNEDTSSGSDNGASGDDDDGGNEPVEFEDEYGRVRMGSKTEAAREARRRAAQAHAAAELDDARARPAVPSNLIYGDTVQAAAFNPEEPIAAKMEAMARKRDRSPTPVEEVHYDASKEVRGKGVGFYAFSQGKERRREEMEELERERQATERVRAEREAAREKKRKEVEERRRLISEKRGRKLADRFLDGLGGELGDLA